MQKRRKHNAAFKAKIALEAAMNNCTVNEVASKYHVHPTQVSQWKRELFDSASLIFEQGRKIVQKEEHAREVSNLHQKIGQLTIEIDWMKKKLNN